MNELRTLTESDVVVPANVPAEARDTYISSYLNATKGTGRIMLFAGDQKIEHLNDDFYGEGVHEDDNTPEHLFRVAAQGEIGVFAAQHGLIAKYGPSYSDVPYVVKMNSKTGKIGVDQADPRSQALCTVQDVVDLREHGGLNILGIGYTIYYGSEYESDMMAEAGKLIAEAHKHGLIAIVWGYPRGKAVGGKEEEKDAHLIAGAAGATTALGADFVKVNMPSAGAESLREATLAAGRTGVLVSGGSSTDVNDFLQFTYDTIHLGGCEGSATGRNVHQKSLPEAVAMTHAMSALVYKNASVEEAMALYQEQSA